MRKIFFISILFFLSTSILLAQKKDSLKFEKYKTAIGKGDTAFMHKEYSLAKKYYKKAHKIYPDQKYPTIQLCIITKMQKGKNE